MEQYSVFASVDKPALFLHSKMTGPFYKTMVDISRNKITYLTVIITGLVYGNEPNLKSINNLKKFSESKHTFEVSSETFESLHFPAQC